MSRDGGLLAVEGEGPVTGDAGSTGFEIVRSDVTCCTSVPNRLLAPRDRRGSTGYFIGLRNASASFGVAAVSPFLLQPSF
jgi:hypothetical protein